MTHYKYRIQVGDEYTYRGSPYALDLLVQCLLDQGPDYLRTQAAVDRLLAKARGEEVAELPPRRPPVPGPGYSDHGRGGLPAGAEAGGSLAQGRRMTELWLSFPGGVSERWPNCPRPRPTAGS